MNKKDIKLSKGVKFTKGFHFTTGKQVDIDIPKDCDLIILMGNSGGGYVPYSCLLPHQVYENDIKEAFEEKHFEVIYVVPINSNAPFPIVFNGDYGKQRWGESSNKEKKK